MRIVPRFPMRRIARFRTIKRGLHEVPFSSSVHCGACRQESARVQGTRRLQRVQLFLCALVMDRIWFPVKHRRRVRAVERCVAHLCWFEANVGPVTVFKIDEWSTKFGHHWFDVAHVHDQSSLPVPFC